MNTEDDEFARIAREQALNKMAENARKLGLDYEPAQQEPWCMKMNGCKTKCEDCPVEVQPAQQEPVAWMWVVDGKPKTVSFGGANSNTPKEWAVLPLYTTPPAQQEPDNSDDLTIAYMAGVQRGKELAQRTWVGLTDHQKMEIWADNEPGMVVLATEAKLKELNT